MSDSVQPHRRQPTRLLCPWEFPGKSTEVGRQCLLRLLRAFEQLLSAWFFWVLPHVCVICLENAGMECFIFSLFQNFRYLSPGWLVAPIRKHSSKSWILYFVCSTVVLRRMIGLDQLLYCSQRESSSLITLIFKN